MATAPAATRTVGTNTDTRARQSVRDAASGVALGALAAFSLRELGLGPILGGDYMLWAASMLGIGLIVGMLGRSGWLLAFDLTLFGLIVLIGWTPLMRVLDHRWIRQDARPAYAIDAIVVLSGRVTSDSTLSGEAADRLLSGLDLIRHSVSARLITTRTFVPLQPDSVSSDADQRRLIELTGLGAGWEIVDSVSTTHDEATRTAELLLPRGMRSVAVVTAPLHTRRACAVFEGAGFQVYCVPARVRSHAALNPLDESDRLAAFGDYIYERLGMLKYRMKGWVR